MREPYNADKEHTVIGMYPPIKGMELSGAKDENGESQIPPTPQFYRPVETYENFHMLFRGETPYWMPQNGWFLCDVNEFRPRQHPDNLANHQGVDGGPYIEYASGPKTRLGWFDIPLDWEPLAMGASVRPGNPILDDMNDWKKLPFPNLDDINWDEMKEMNKEYLSTDKANQLGIQFGFWERMMNLMDVSGAAMALLDEDQEDAIHDFLDRLSDLYIEYIRRMLSVGRIDSVMLHDDWGTQNAPFFSLATCREFFVPPMKKVVDFCHANNIVFEHHCCGKAEPLVPAMVECGTDYWFPQAALNDLDRMIDTYKNEHITFSVSSPFLPAGSSPSQVEEIARQFVDKYKDKGILFCQNINLNGTPGYDPMLYPIFADAVYAYSRMAYQSLIA